MRGWTRMVVVKPQVQETAGAIEETGALPPGWVKLQVRSSGIEYYRHEDGQVLWKRPTHDKNDTSLFSPIGALGRPEGQATLVTPGTPSFLSPTGHTKPTPARTHWSPPPPTPAGGQTRPGSAQEDGPLSEQQIAAGWKRCCISCAPYPCGPCMLWHAPVYVLKSRAIELEDALPHALFCHSCTGTNRARWGESSIEIVCRARRSGRIRVQWNALRRQLLRQQRAKSPLCPWRHQLALLLPDLSRFRVLPRRTSPDNISRQRLPIFPCRRLQVESRMCLHVLKKRALAGLWVRSSNLWRLLKTRQRLLRHHCQLRGREQPRKWS